MTRVIKHAKAWRDIHELAVHMGHDSPDAALQFLEHVERTVAFIAKHPRAARTRHDLDPPFDRLRSRLVDGFPNHVIFYRVTSSAIVIVRVLHGSRDLPRELTD